MKLLTGLMLALLSCTILNAQATGTLRGRVLDPSGAYVPGASVVVTASNNDVKVAETDANGNFLVNGLAAGDYAIRTSAAGFSLAEGKLNLPAGRVTAFDVRLNVAADRQEVTVEEKVQVELDPASNASAIVLNNEDLGMLSDNTDDLQNELLQLAGPAAGPNGGQIFIDGFSNGQLPPKESIREIRINSNPFSAEFDRSGQGRVEIFTRPGTDKLRGSANFNFSDNAINARNPYSPTKPPMQYKQYNANVGGSLTKKASFNIELGRNQQNDTNFINAQILDANFQPVRFYQNIDNPNIRNYVSPRIDYALTKNITLQGRYYLTENTGHNNGTGGFSLLSRGTTNTNSNQNVQLTETAVIGARLVNETRFQYSKNHNTTLGDSGTPAISVLDSFTGGGASATRSYNYNDNFEIQNNTSYTRGVHFLRVGVRLRSYSQDSFSPSNYNGTYTFTSITSYGITQQGLAQGLPIDQIRALGGGARQYSVAGGQPLATVKQVDVAPFLQEDWRVKPNITLSLGVRYEIQTNISDQRAWAPRIGVAWGLGKANGRTQPKTVLRAGFGTFFDRFPQGLTLQALRQNGINQQNFVVIDPGFFPDAPPVSSLIATQLPQAIYKVDAKLIAPTMYQSALSVERQLPHNMTLSVSFNDTRGVHQLRSRNINAPMPDGVYPFGNRGQLYLYESSGIFKQTQISVNLNARVNTRIQMFGYYAYGHASSNTDGSGSFPANNYDLSTEWGRAGFDIRHRFQMGGNLALPFKLRISPNISWQSAPAFNITSGVDQNGDTNFNDRPAFATDLTRPSVRLTPWGNFDFSPLPGAVIIPRNFGEGFGRLDVSARVQRTWAFGERKSSGTPTGNRNNNNANASGRWNVTAGLQARNLINHLNPGSPNGNLSSQLFGQSLNAAGGVRRLELNLRFDF